MPTVTQCIRRRLLAGVPTLVPDLETLRRTERSPEFERLCANRLAIGAMRYGLLGAPGKPKYNRVADAIRRLEQYRADCNAEHLVDVANIMLLEFVEGDHLGVISTDDTQHAQPKES